MKRLLLSVITAMALGACQGPPDATQEIASAYTVISSSPWGSSVPVDAYFGYDTSAQRVRIGWHRADTGACSFENLTSAPNVGLGGTWTGLINLPSTSDSFEIPSNTSNGVINAYMSCPDGTHTFADFMWLGESLTVHGNGGNDYMVCSRPGTSCYGDAGADYMVSNDNRFVSLDGGDGDDVLHLTVSTTQGSVNGQAGNDCIQGTSTGTVHPALYSCGPTHEAGDGSYGAQVGIDCTSRQTACP